MNMVSNDLHLEESREKPVKLRVCQGEYNYGRRLMSLVKKPDTFLPRKMSSFKSDNHAYSVNVEIKISK